MVPQLDGTYNVSDDSDTDSHSYLDLASSNIIAHRMRGQKQRYEINTRANTSRCLALKEGTKPKEEGTWAPVAQTVEHLTCNREVVGSMPAWVSLT